MLSVVGPEVSDHCFLILVLSGFFILLLLVFDIVFCFDLGFCLFSFLFNFGVSWW